MGSLRRAPWTRLALACALAAGLGAWVGCGRGVEMGREMRRLEIPLPPAALGVAAGLSAPIPIAGGEIHETTYELERGDFLRVVVEQEGIDLALLLVDAAGREVAEADGIGGAHGREDLMARAEAPGPYRLEITPYSDDAPGGTYRYHLLARRPASREDGALVRLNARLAKELKQKEKPAEKRVQAFREILADARQLGEEHLAARALYELLKLYQGREPLTSALLGEEAGEIYLRLGERLLAANAFHFSGVERIGLGDAERAGEDLAAACELLSQLRAADRLVRCWSHLSAVHQGQGELQESWNLLLKAEEMLREIEDPIAEALLRTDQGDLLLDLQQPEEALRSYRRAAQIYADHQRLRGQAWAKRGIARAFVQLQDLQGAAREATEALELLGADPLPKDLSSLLVMLGTVRRHQGKDRAAVDLLRRALAVAREHRLQQLEAVIRIELGYVLARSAAPTSAGSAESPSALTEALEHFDEAYRLSSEQLDRRGQASAEARAAEALARHGELEKAMLRLEPALDRVELLRADTGREDFRLGYYALRQEYYRIGLDILMRLHAADPTGEYARQALLLHDRRLARELTESLAGGGDRTASKGPEQLQIEEIERQLGRAATELSSQPERMEQMSELLSQYQEARARRFEAEGVRNLSHRLPERRDGSFVEELRAKLLDDTSLLLVFALGDEKSYLWALSRQDEQVHLLPSRERLESAVQSFLAKVLEKSSDSRRDQRRLGKVLGEELLGPVAGSLGDRRLLLIPEGILQAVPWGALIEPGAGPGAEAGGYLAENHEIHLLPSVSALALLRARGEDRPKGRLDLIAIGAPLYQAPERGAEEAGASGATPSRPARPAPATDLERAVGRLMDGSLESLPHTREEVESIAELVLEDQCRVALGLEAKRDLVLSGELARYRILHFAAHGFWDPDFPELSKLVLSTVDQEGRPINGFVHAYEIAGLTLPADLVVLSACQTGIGKLVPGEGMLSLSRSFLVAGSTQVLSTLWRVSDTHTVRFMRIFYEGYLRDGVSAGEALRRAQLEMIRDPKTAAPYYWAGFTLQGDWGGEIGEGRQGVMSVGR